jgi:hypothetical protein
MWVGFPIALLPSPMKISGQLDHMGKAAAGRELY